MTSKVFSIKSWWMGDYNILGKTFVVVKQTVLKKYEKLKEKDFLKYHRLF